jgi:hypothetical protein
MSNGDHGLIGPTLLELIVKLGTMQEKLRDWQPRHRSHIRHGSEAAGVVPLGPVIDPWGAALNGAAAPLFAETEQCRRAVRPTVAGIAGKRLLL